MKTYLFTLIKLGCLLLLLFMASDIYALEITEIMYNPEGTDAKREWIEVYNDEDQSIDLVNYYLLENDVNHGINHFSGPAELSPGSYAIIASDAGTIKSEHNGSYAIYDSVFTLNNTGEKIALLNDELDEIISLRYQADWGADGDGNSLNLISNQIWQPRNPSPGGPANDAAITTDAKNYSRELKPIKSVGNKTVINYKDLPRYAIAEQEVEFKLDGPSKYNYDWQIMGSEIMRGRYVKHEFALPGTKTINITVTENGKTVEEYDHQIIIEVPKILLSHGRYKLSPYLKITNQNSAKLNLSNWNIYVGQQHYKLPGSLNLMAGDDYAFLMTDEIAYPILMLDQNMKIVLAIKTPDNKNDQTVIDNKVPERSVINTRGNPGEVLEVEGDEFVTNQGKLREIFASYQEEGTSVESIAPRQSSGAEILAASVAESNDDVNNAEGGGAKLWTIVNSLFLIILGMTLVLFWQTKNLSAREFDKNEIKKDSQDAQDYEIIEVTDEEDF